MSSNKKLIFKDVFAVENEVFRAEALSNLCIAISMAMQHSPNDPSSYFLSLDLLGDLLSEHKEQLEKLMQLS